MLLSFIHYLFIYLNIEIVSIAIGENSQKNMYIIAGITTSSAYKAIMLFGQT